jgi:hypothetical protein
MANLDMNFSEDLSVGASRYVTAEVALSKVVGIGFNMPPKPTLGYSGYLPLNLGQLSNPQLGALLTEISIWLAWAEGRLSIASAEKNDAEKKLEYLQSGVRIGIKAMSDSKMTTQDKDDAVKRDGRVHAAELVALEKYAAWDIIRSFVRGAQKDWETVSRHITIQGQEIDRASRESFLGNVPTKSTQFRR